MGRPKNGKNIQRTCQEKVALIEEYYNSGKGYKVFATEKGISPSLFYNWICKYNEGGMDNLRFRSKMTEKRDSDNQEIVELKMLIAEQQLEIQSLKKLLDSK